MSVVLIGGLDEYFIAVARGLLKRGVRVTHFLDRFQFPETRQAELASVISVDARQFMDPERVVKLNEGKPRFINALLLASFREAELTWLAVSDRYTHEFSFAARRRLFRELLEYFYRWLREGEIHTIVFPNVPHAGWNNVLYCVAKYFGITTFILEATRLSDRVMLWNEYEASIKVPDTYLTGETRDKVRSYIPDDLLTALESDSSWMKLSDDINEDSLKQFNPIAEFGTLVRQLVSAASTRVFTRPLLFDPPWVWWQGPVRRYQLRRRAYRLRDLYEYLAIRDVPEEKYVLFFLNYQPEKTTTPMGGVFDDQLLAVGLLAESLPDGWKILVKEHPRQFGSHVDASIYRSESFYTELAQIDSVELVHPTAPTGSLLAGCEATATITGSIGWQGLLQGKCSLNFGRSWYAACASCYMVSSIPEIQAALADIKGKDAAAVELDVLKFLAYLQSEFIIGSNATRYAKLSSRSFEELVDGLSDALAQRILQGSPVLESQEHASV